MYLELSKEKRKCGCRDVNYSYIHCTTHDEHYWTKTNHFKAGVVSCKECSRLQRLGNADNNRHIEELEETFPQYIFCPNRPKWGYRCNNCGHIGESSLDKLKSGRKGCKCSALYRWSAEEREFQIENILKEEDNLISFSLEKYNTTVDSLLLVTCIYHGEFPCTVNNFVNHSSRCPSCAKEFSESGLYKNKVYDKDFLYLIIMKKEGESFIKVGRSFNPYSRYKSIERNSDYSVVTTYIIKEDTHYEIFHTEKDILREFKALKYIPESYFKGFTECFTLDAQDLIKEYVKK